MSDDRPLTGPVDRDTDTRIRRDLADIGASTGLKLDPRRTPDADGLVYCCVTMGRVTPAVAAAHARRDPTP